jgi:predicted Zn-dependent protease
MKTRFFSSLLLISFTFFSSCASNPAKTQETLAPSMAEDEIQIGREIHNKILSSFYPYTDPKVVSYVNGIGQDLAKHAQRQDLIYQFTILYNDKIYATSAPGGFVYVTTGMLYFLQNEAELAAVLAHEIGELQYKDPKLSQSRKVLEAVTRGGAMVGPAFGPIGVLAALGLVAVHSVAESKVKAPEDRILESDKRALNYMVQAEYDPQGMIDVLYEFVNAQKEIAPYFFDYYESRPISPERFRSLQDHFSKLPLQGKSFSTNHKAYEEVMKGIREIYKT